MGNTTIRKPEAHQQLQMHRKTNMYPGPDKGIVPEPSPRGIGVKAGRYKKQGNTTFILGRIL